MRELLSKDVIIDNGCFKGRKAKVVACDNIWLYLKVEGWEKEIKYKKKEVIFV